MDATFTAQLLSIKVWSKSGESRVYVNFKSGEDAVKQLTASKYAKAGAWSGRPLTADEIATVRELSIKDGKWTNWYAPRDDDRAPAVTRVVRSTRDDSRSEEEGGFGGRGNNF